MNVIIILWEQYKYWLTIYKLINSFLSKLVIYNLLSYEFNKTLLNKYNYETK